MPDKNIVQSVFSMPVKSLRNSVKALIIRGDKILCTKNSDLLGDFYLLPGGGQNHGETMRNAIIRECREELGAIVEVGKLCFVREYISANHELAIYDDSIHQIELIFFCELLEEPQLNMALNIDVMQVGIEWLAITSLNKLRFYPSSLIEPLKTFNPDNFNESYLGDTL